jgi:serine/threonine protein kinase
MERLLWDRIQEIYSSTLRMDQSLRREFVANACDHDPVLENEINSLLKADESAGAFLETPVFEIGLKIISSSGANGANHASVSALDPWLGKTIERRYLIESELGHGGMGKVYLARDLTLHNRHVVIKVLLEASLQNPYVVKKFKQEVEALARIDHPGVVNVLSAGQLPDKTPYIAMQYVRGVTLRSQIVNEGMNLERAAAILKQIGEALEDIHENGIFHRDLKPDNIMLQPLSSGAELVKVVDFGIAKVKDSMVGPSTVDKVSVGTVVYMSPEQVRGGERLTAASDIYSMGVIAYEMVTGRRPFNPTSAAQLLEMHRDGVRVKPVDLRASISTEAQAIILKSLSFEREARYQSAAEFGDTLAHALLNEEETAPRPRSTQGRYSRDLSLPTTLQPDADGWEPGPTRNSRNNSESPNHGPFRLGKPQFAAVGILLAILLGVAVVLWRPEPTREVHVFTYYLTVQRMRDNKAFGDPFDSTGRETFESGDKFRLNISTSHPGYLYLFNEGPPEPGGSSFTILYPTPATNNGSATLGADQWMQTNWNTFGGAAGPENFWIVWSAAPVAQLETAKAEAFKEPNGALIGTNLDAVKSFLTAKQNESNPHYSTDKSTHQTTVRGTGDVVVKMVKFEHR